MTPTDICNLALSQVPAGPITNLDEVSVAARACKLWYPQVLDELMERGPWRFAITRQALAVKETNTRSASWEFEYTKPANLALVIGVYDSLGSGAQTYDYVGNSIFSDAPDAVIDFITTAETSSFYTAQFRSALIALMAARLCMPITKNMKREEALVKASEVAIERAQAANHNERGTTYGNHIPDILRGRMGLPLGGYTAPGPEAVYPDFNPVDTFESELG